MRRTRPLGKFRKDLKRVSKRGWNVNKLNHTIMLLQVGEPLPESARPHKLSGMYEGLWECHIEADWLLIYKVTDKEVVMAHHKSTSIFLTRSTMLKNWSRTGTHADLFE